MRPKARSRKKKQFRKTWERIGKIIAAIVEVKSVYQKIRELKYPKMAIGGTVYAKVGEKHTINFDGSKEDHEYLNKMTKLFKESETVVLHNGNSIVK